jgi:phytoene synthase
VSLDGGPVIDFGAVKDSTSRAEVALAEAREKYEASLDAGGSHAGEGGRLMGINDEVVAEVGYEIGTFIDEYVDKASGETAEELVQKCGRYLRSKASLETFPDSWQDRNGLNSFSQDDISRFDRLLAAAYEESGVVTSAFAKTFYLGTQVLPDPAMRAIWAVYVWCRRTDEIVDAPRPEAADPNAEMLTDLSEWEIRLERLFDRGEVVDVLDLPLLDCKVKYPNLPIMPFSDMIRGMLMDIPGLGQERYNTWDELHLYCYRVAGTVGLMSMPVFGCAPGYTDEMAKEPALSLGVAFQITNILRDVGEDATTRGRVYLPQRDMERFGVTEQQLMDQIVDENYVNLMKFEIARARMYYTRALRGVEMLRPESRLPVQLSLDAYGKILDKIEENNYDSLTKRAYVGKWEKLAGLPASWYRTLDISKMLPLPEDWDRPSLDEYEKELEDMIEKKWEEQS